jgi:hypothetical protein
LNQFSAKFSVKADRGKITCPHCGQVLPGDDNSMFLTHALLPAQETEFNARHPPEKNGQ